MGRVGFEGRQCKPAKRRRARQTAARSMCTGLIAVRALIVKMRRNQSRFNGLIKRADLARAHAGNASRGFIAVMVSLNSRGNL